MVGCAGKCSAIIEPIAGASAILKYEAIKDKSDTLWTYKVWVEKE